MSHLSISLRDEFDCTNDSGFVHTPAKKDRSYLGEDVISDSSPFPLTPMKNRSFTSSCASIEEQSDFFCDADVDSISSNESGYSSGTF